MEACALQGVEIEVETWLAGEILWDGKFWLVIGIMMIYDGERVVCGRISRPFAIIVGVSEHVEAWYSRNVTWTQ